MISEARQLTRECALALLVFIGGLATAAFAGWTIFTVLMWFNR